MKARNFVVLVCMLFVILGIRTYLWAECGAEENVPVLTDFPVAEEFSDADITAIRTIFDDWKKALNAGDLDAILALYTDQTVEIFPNGVANVGKANMTRRWKGFMPNYDYEAMDYSDIKIMGIEDTAMCCMSFSQTYHYRDSEKTTVREGRQFFILKKIEGSWKIALGHWVFDK